MNNIPPIDLARQYRNIGDQVSAAVTQVLASGRYIGGPVVQELEQQFAQYTGVSQAVSCNSGTDALYLALLALGIGPGDEVITSAFTFFSTAEVISLVGAVPVFVDIDPGTFNMDVGLVEAAITGKTKAIMPVHLFGCPVEMTGLLAIADRYNLVVIEDCAQATGATWGNRRVGSLGTIGCFSFFPTKNLGAFGDGGMVTTNSPDLAAMIRKLKEHGSSQRYLHELIGINSRLDAIQAAILRVKLPYLEGWNRSRAAAARHYTELLAPLGDILITPKLVAESVWNQYTIRVLAGRRDRLREKLQAQGISTMVYYPLPLHLQPVYADLGYAPGRLPVTEALSQQVLSLPMFPEITPEEQQQVVYSLKDCLVDLD